MKKQVLFVVIVLVAIASVLFAVLNVTAPAFSPTLTGLVTPTRTQTPLTPTRTPTPLTPTRTPTPLTPTRTPTPLPGDFIPLKPIAGLTSLNATIRLDVNGLIDGQRAQGGLDAVFTTNDQGSKRITVSGSLLGPIASQVGGSLVGLFVPSEVDIYKVPEGTYVVVNGVFAVCVKPADSEATAALDEISPQSLLSMLTSRDVARGKLVGPETLNGVSVKHYVLNGDTFLAAAQKSSDPQLRAFGEGLWSAEDADLYVDATGGYPVAFRGSYSGSYEPLKFEGDFDVQIELTGVNTNTPVDLPASCNNPISR